LICYLGLDTELLKLVLLERKENLNEFILDSSCIHIKIPSDFWVEDLPHDAIDLKFLADPE
jgi:hypothetical protein